MGFLGGLFGKRSEADSIRSRMAAEVSREMLMTDPRITQTLFDIIKGGYENSGIPSAVHRLGNALRHHAGLSQEEGRKILDHPFMERYIEEYGLELYRIGFGLGHQAAIGQADSTYRKEIGILCADVGEKMKSEAGKTITNVKIIECFIISGKAAFDQGVEDGENLGNQEYIMVKK